jgi:methylmalonyl-CoA mutase N-terminal domain/subunit
MQDEIARSAYAYQRAIEDNTKIIVGVNKFQMEEGKLPPLLKIDDSIRQIQTDKINKLKAERNNAAVQQCLAAIDAAAKDGTNLMPLVISAVEAKCTLGEIADVLRNVYGEYR